MERDQEELLLRLQRAGSTPEQMAAMAEALADGKPRTPGWFVVLGRSRRTPSQQNLDAFAKALDLDVYTARQRLAAPTPRILRREDKEAAAREWVEWLAKVEVTAFIIPEEQLAEQEFVSLAALHIENDLFLADDLKSNRLNVKKKDIVCVVTGEVREKAVVERTSRDLFGDRLIEHGRQGQRLEAFIDIHRRSAPVSLRIAQDSFSWSTAYPAETVQSSLHIRKFLDRLKEALPNVPVLSDFAAAESALGNSLQAVDSSSYLALNWPWISFTTRTRLEKVKTRLESNQPHFDLYSSLLRWEILGRRNH